ncbi:MAG: hypothetical protein JWO91_2260 [Acidobacteriaceae bacterium]|jgi:hypothetical protein|nr:hypothetical protein [Acidobacteriaceae bacterium]
MLAEIVCSVQTYKQTYNKLKYLEWKAHFRKGNRVTIGKNAANGCGYV